MIDPVTLGLAIGALWALKSDPVSQTEQTPDYFEVLLEGSEEMAGTEGYANLIAFLEVIRVGESSDDYLKLVGGGNFSGYQEHPYLTTPKKFYGIALENGLISTAAGAYQITATTWKSLGGVEKYGSFSPSAQTRAAIDLIKRRGAMGRVLAGQFDDAVFLLRYEWEIFTVKSFTAKRAKDIYLDAGGELA